jgi:hypothetical protein
MIRAICLLTSLLVSSLGVADEDPMANLTLVPDIPPRAEEQLEVMGVTTFSMLITIEGDKNVQLNLYYKPKGKEDGELLVRGPVIRNDDNGTTISRRVLVTMDGLEVEPRQESLRAGVGVFGGPSGLSATKIIANPIPKADHLAIERVSFYKDAKNRIVLVQGYQNEVPVIPGLSKELGAVFLAIDSWKPENGVEGVRPDASLAPNPDVSPGK